MEENSAESMEKAGKFDLKLYVHINHKNSTWGPSEGWNDIEEYVRQEEPSPETGTRILHTFKKLISFEEYNQTLPFHPYNTCIQNEQ